MDVLNVIFQVNFVSRGHSLYVIQLLRYAQMIKFPVSFEVKRAMNLRFTATLFQESFLHWNGMP